MRAPTLAALLQGAERVVDGVRLIRYHIDEFQRLRLTIGGDFLGGDVVQRGAPFGVGERLFLVLGEVGEAEGGNGGERFRRGGGEGVNGAGFRVVRGSEFRVAVLFHHAQLGGRASGGELGDGEPRRRFVDGQPFRVDVGLKLADPVDERVRLRVIRVIEGDGQQRFVVRRVGIGGVVEKAEAGIVFLVLDRVVGMAVALHAAHREALENLPCGHVAIHRSHQAELLVVGAALAVHLGKAVKGGGEFLVESGAGDEVAGELVDDELVVGKVVVEGLDEPVAVFPDVAVGVVAQAFGIGVTREIHPDGGPAFAEARGGEQALGLGGNCGGEILFGGGLEGVEFREGGREADEIEGSAAQPLGGLGGGGGREVFRLELGEDEAVDVVRRPCGVFYRRSWMIFGCGERPMLAPFRALGDPFPQGLHIGFAEARAVVGLRHEIVGIIGDHTGDHFRFLRLPGHDDGFPRLAFSENLVAENERDSAGLLDPAVAGDAVLVEDGLDVAGEINFREGVWCGG